MEVEVPLFWGRTRIGYWTRRYSLTSRQRLAKILSSSLFSLPRDRLKLQWPSTSGQVPGMRREQVYTWLTFLLKMASGLAHSRQSHTHAHRGVWLTAEKENATHTHLPLNKETHFVTQM